MLLLSALHLRRLSQSERSPPLAVRAVQRSCMPRHHACEKESCIVGDQVTRVVLGCTWCGPSRRSRACRPAPPRVGQEE